MVRITLKFQFLELYRETDQLLSVIVGTWDSGDFILIENWLSGNLFDPIPPVNLMNFISFSNGLSETDETYSAREQ